MKIVLEIANEPKKGDLLLFNGKEWEAINKDLLLKHLSDKTEEVDKSNKQECLELKRSIEVLKRQIDMKLESYHNILQNITREE